MIKDGDDWLLEIVCGACEKHVCDFLFFFSNRNQRFEAFAQANKIQQPPPQNLVFSLQFPKHTRSENNILKHTSPTITKLMSNLIAESSPSVGHTNGDSLLAFGEMSTFMFVFECVHKLVNYFHTFCTTIESAFSDMVSAAAMFWSGALRVSM